MRENFFKTRGPLIGCDISHHNYPFSYNFGDFQIHKATEGRSFTDNKFLEWCERRKEFELLIGSGTMLNGAYHFASNIYNTAAEAEHFLNTVSKGAIRCILILDLEGDALNQEITSGSRGEKAADFLWYVKKKTGVTPFLYTNTYGTSVLTCARLTEFPLWIASYNKKTPAINSGIFQKTGYRMWQFTSKPFDMDLFSGSTEDWNKYVWKI